MPEPAAAKVYADPDEALLVRHQVDVVVAGADRAELGRGLLAVVLHASGFPGLAVVEQVMLDALVIRSADAERDGSGDVLGDWQHLVLDVIEARIEPHRHVAATDVEANAGDADLPFVGDDAADRLGVAEMPIRTQHACDGVAHGHAVAHLRCGGLLMLAHDEQRAIPVFGLLLRRIERGRQCRRLELVVLPAGRLAERAPDGLRAMAPRHRRPIVGIETRRGSELTRSDLVWIGFSHGHSVLLTFPALRLAFGPSVGR